MHQVFFSLEVLCPMGCIDLFSSALRSASSIAFNELCRTSVKLVAMPGYLGQEEQVLTTLWKVDFLPLFNVRGYQPNTKL